VLDREVHFLNPAGFGGRHDEGLVHDLHETAAVPPEQGNDGNAALPRRTGGRKKIGALSARAMENEEVGRPAESLDLAGEYLLETHVVGGGREERGVGRQSEGRETWPFLLMADDVFRRDMLRIRGAAPVPGEEERAAPSQSLGIPPGESFDLRGE
jgi:hypothetical protein